MTDIYQVLCIETITDRFDARVECFRPFDSRAGDDDRRSAQLVPHLGTIAEALCAGFRLLAPPARQTPRDLRFHWWVHRTIEPDSREFCPDCGSSCAVWPCESNQCRAVEDTPLGKAQRDKDALIRSAQRDGYQAAILDVAGMIRNGVEVQTMLRRLEENLAKTLGEDS